jgi:hypothetical protein
MSIVGFKNDSMGTRAETAAGSTDLNKLRFQAKSRRLVAR